METWQIVLLIGLALFLVFAFMRSKKLAILAAPAVKNNSVGGQLSRSVPIYGQAVKLASIVEKPAAQIFNGVNNAVTHGLEHIPVVGGLVSLPTKVAGKIVNGALDFLGF